MKLHIVSGFLGSGKTTAIAHAAQGLSAQGERVAVITNDQGHQLVDTAYLQGQGIPTAEIAGGCFCCRFDELVSAVEEVGKSSAPAVAFAEAVGSCTDLVATVIRPLNELHGADIRVASFSVFVDIQLAGNWLAGVGLPFSDDVCYIFEKQLEEAQLIVVNKSDLVSQESGLRIARAMESRFPHARVLLHSSLDAQERSGWLSMIESGAGATAGELEVDYARYGSGEARLGWYNSLIRISRPPDVRPFLDDFLATLGGLVREGGAPVGHLKIAFPNHPRLGKLSMTATGDLPTMHEIDDALPELALILNARVELPADELSELVESALRRASEGDGSRRWEVPESEHFHPAFPRPTHRLTSRPGTSSSG